MIVKYTKEEYDNAKSTDKLALQCERCGKIFYTEKKLIVFETKHNRGRLKFCSAECSSLAHRNRHFTHCEECGKEFEILNKVYNKSKTKRFFCSESCAAKYNNRLRKKPSEETKNKIRESIIAYYRNKFGEDYKVKKKNTGHTPSLQKEYTCRICNRKYHLNKNGSSKMFCSRECLNEYRTNRKKYLSEETILKLSIGGRHSTEAQGENRRSKNEKYFCELCEKHFNSVKHNEPMFNGWDADIIIEDIKVAVLWNGRWHYEKIKENHSVEQVQNRDKIKIEEIKKCGYTPYIVKDMGKYNPQFVKKEFEKFINIAG